MNKIQFKKGFTLIELLLVIAIVSVLASIFTFNSTQAKEKSRDAHMAAESHQVELALNMFKEKNGFMPSDNTVTAGQVYTEDKFEYQKNLKPLVDSGFIPSIPKSPDGKSYAYGVSTDRNSAVFIANLKVTKSNTNLLESTCSSFKSFANQNNVDWSKSIAIVESSGEFAQAWCNNNDFYMCVPFSGGSIASLPIIKSQCKEDYYGDPTLYNTTPWITGDRPEKICQNMVNYYSIWLSGSPDDNLVMFPVEPVTETTACDGSNLNEHCICVE